jgi:two-component system LytT family response regulator
MTSIDNQKIISHVIGSIFISSTVASIIYYIFKPALHHRSSDSQIKVSEAIVARKETKHDVTNDENVEFLLSLVIPAYNEEDRLPLMLKHTISYLMESKDDISQLCYQALGIEEVVLSNHGKNLGRYVFNPPFQILIVDDEELARARLLRMLGTLGHESVSMAQNGEEAIELAKEELFELIFLDINMPNGSGFDFLECIDIHKTNVIFVTAHDDFDIKAIKFQVFDYLVKPIDIDIFNDTLERLEAKIFNSNLQHLIHDEKVSFSTANEIVYLKLDDILYCESDNSYCTIYTKSNESIIISSSLQKVQEKLSDTFFRCHQSYLINKDEIIKYLKHENKILLSNNMKIPLSKTNKKELLDYFQG